MAVAIKPFRKLQRGIETTPGTLVAATFQALGEWKWDEQAKRYRSGYPRQINANVGGAGVDLMKHVAISIDGELSAEDFPWVLGSGVRGGITGGVATDGVYTRTYTPQLTTAPTGPDALTFEEVESDGTTNHIARECGYGTLDSFEITSTPNENVKIVENWFARASQTSTPTGSLVPVTNQEPLVGNLLKVYLDTTYAGMGGTQLAGLVHNASFKYTSPFSPKYTMDGRSDLDFVGLHYDRGFKATLDLTIELDATGATAAITSWRANTLRYIRLHFLGSVTGGGTTARFIKIDGAYRWAGDSRPAIDDETRMVSMSLESVYDTTGTKTLEFIVGNGNAAIPA